MKRIKKTLPVMRLGGTFCFALFLVLATGCGETVDNDASCAGVLCTASWDYVGISVVDQNGNPVTDASITAKIKATQEVLAINQHFFDTNRGFYVVFDDTFVHTVTTDAAGETLTVIGTSQGRSFTVEIVVNADRCRCHVRKVSGPSTVTLQQEPC